VMRRNMLTICLNYHIVTNKLLLKWFVVVKCREVLLPYLAAP
jgi:hypothetical protein